MPPRSDLTSWHHEITLALQTHSETWDDVVASTLSESALHAKFNRGYGAAEGEPFTIWTHNRVYFPATYDGAEWVASVARNPNGTPTEHIGGG